MLLPLSCRETKIVLTCDKNFSRKMEKTCVAKTQRRAHRAPSALRKRNEGHIGGTNGILNRHAKLVCYAVTFINCREMLLRFMGVKLCTFLGGSCPLPGFQNFSIRPMVLTVARQIGIRIHKFNIGRTNFFFQKSILLLVFVNPIPLPPIVHERTYLNLQSGRGAIGHLHVCTFPVIMLITFQRT